MIGFSRWGPQGLKPKINDWEIAALKRCATQKRHSGKMYFALCVRNEDYPASLELRKVYQVLTDQQAMKHRQMRVIDESGEDYLYPQEYFVPIKVPQAAERAVLKAI